MTDIQQRAQELEQMALAATAKERLKLLPQIDRTISTMTSRGFAVPASLRSLNNRLKEEAIEDMFDNLPV